MPVRGDFPRGIYASAYLTSDLTLEEAKESIEEAGEKVDSTMEAAGEKVEEMTEESHDGHNH